MSMRVDIEKALLGEAVRAMLMKAEGGEGWAEADPALPKIERRSIAALLTLWAALEAEVFATLSLPKTKGAKTKAELPPFRFDAVASLTELLRMQEIFVQAAGAERGPLVQAMFDAWLRGLANAQEETDSDPIPDALRRVRGQYAARGMELVRNATVRSFREDIVARLVAGEFDGMNPVEVAAKLRQRFGAHDYDWVRLARSETAMAQVDGKLEQYAEAGITHVHYVTAKDSRVSRICRDLAAAGPYLLAVAPVPVRSSHPGCRCSLRAVAVE